MPNEARRSDARRLVPLTFRHDAALPITGQREVIGAALKQHQVVIVAGETGSGKSTQLPQYCLELERGLEGLIAHTQPRRLAARALAARIAEELGQSLGATVGFRVRFVDRVSDATRLVLLTDGLLLAELTADPLLRRYDTIIVDEAHERTLNIDLLLGVLKRLLPRRPDLKLIVTSATLDVERVARFFGDAPIITVSGRSFPVEVRYAAPTEDDPDLAAAVLAAFRTIEAAPERHAGDVLVFLPGEREIRDVGEALERELGADVEVLPLYSRLSWEQQRRIFEAGARRRIVLATNVAETSITVPRIRFVIDSGLARVSRYSPRNRLQRLPIEPVSRASADQRKGRCGRLGPGLCIRLFAAEDFDTRAPFTEPEVLRTNLAGLLLRLAADGLGAAESFPFIDPPDARALGDGYRLLQELEAFDADRRITRLGRSMARLPLDPRLARALLESKRFHAEAELLAIVAGLSVADTRVALPDGGEEGVGSSAFEDHKSEFSVLVKVWRAYRRAREGSPRELRQWCKEKGLSLLRLSEWDDVHGQVTERAAALGIVPQRKSASYTGVHRALLAGFCTMVGSRAEDGSYLGTRGVRFNIAPGSPLKRRRPPWILAASIVETTRVYARRVAEVEANWIESAAHHLLKREYLEPDWDESREAVMARERVGFLGLTLSANRLVNYGPIAPEESRRIFAREALVYRRLAQRPPWLRDNDAAIDAAERIEERLRTRELLRPAESFVEFYDRMLPRQVSSGATLEYFTRHMNAEQRQALVLKSEEIFARPPDPEQLDRFPEETVLATSTSLTPLRIPVGYRFAPSDAEDGVTLEVPLLALPTLMRSSVERAIPGLLRPKVEALLRSLPKEARRSLIPIGATAASFVDFMTQQGADLRSIAAWLQESRGVPEGALRFDPSAVPAHLTPRLAVVAESGERSEGTDLPALRRGHAAAARAALQAHARRCHGEPWRRFELEELPVQVGLEIAGGVLQVYPALRASRDGPMLSYEWSAPEAGREWRRQATSVARSMLDRQSRDLAKRAAQDHRLMLAAAPYMTTRDLIDLLLHLAVRQACFGDHEPPRTRPAFEEAVDAAREALYPAVETATVVARGWFTEAQAVRRLCDDPRSRAHAPLARHTLAHLSNLLAAPHLLRLSPDWLRQVPRYLKGETRRWERLQSRGGEPPQVREQIEGWARRAQDLEARLEAEQRWIPEIDELRGWIEEFRVSLYAQELRTLGPISAARLESRAVEIEAWIAR